MLTYNPDERPRKTDEIVTEGDQHTQGEGIITRVIDVHIYDLPVPEQEPPNVKSEPVPTPQQTGRVWRVARWSAVCALVVSVPLFLWFSPLLVSADATITIVPVSRQIRTTSMITVVVGQTPTGQQVAGRTLGELTMSQQQSGPATGRAHQDASAAHGFITFYNAAPFTQTVPGETIITGADGVQIVTDQDAIIPAARYPTFGETTVAAHALTTGPEGNIRVADVYGPCCRLNISAVNSPFTGGQPARDYATVIEQDVASVVSSLTKSLLQSERAALQTQVASDETLITPLPCQQTITPDHQPGEEATQVHVTVSETCNGVVYNTQRYQEQLVQRVTQQAGAHLEGYHMTGLQQTVDQVTPTQQGVALQVHLTATYAYQFTQEQQQALISKAASKSKAQATNALLQAPGVQSVAISLTDKDTRLPADAKRIHLIVLEP